MILSGEVTLCRVREKTKKQLAQKNAGRYPKGDGTTSRSPVGPKKSAAPQQRRLVFLVANSN
jgi:hypothetical protein